MPLDKHLCAFVALVLAFAAWLVLLSPVSEPARRAYVKDCAPICAPFGVTQAGGYEACHCDHRVVVKARHR